MNGPEELKRGVEILRERIPPVSAASPRESERLLRAMPLTKGCGTVARVNRDDVFGATAPVGAPAPQDPGQIATHRRHRCSHRLENHPSKGMGRLSHRGARPGTHANDQKQLRQVAEFSHVTDSFHERHRANHPCRHRNRHHSVGDTGPPTGFPVSYPAPGPGRPPSGNGYPPSGCRRPSTGTPHRYRCSARPDRQPLPNPLQPQRPRRVTSGCRCAPPASLSEAGGLAACGCRSGHHLVK